MTGQAGRALALWSARRWAVALAAAGASALAVGVPTDVVPNPLFGRSVPVQWWNYPILALTAVLGGLVIASYAGRRRSPQGGDAARRLGPLGLMSLLAVGCPTCNKLVLVLVGSSGALTVWAPLQPWLGALSVVLLAVATVRRLSGEVVCPAPSGV
ncbi:hypothetical protein DZF91_34370 [Actinomadura logoneensis]|uniref:Uncharacterized protein n=2 Tax=Actinomadura logoneensis TaxID=2293572 RepID=A0A372JBD0_9ACTN|nr:hypothetical protein DZF91_34370 [Actinomadura logoneensis]